MVAIQITGILTLIISVNKFAKIWKCIAAVVYDVIVSIANGRVHYTAKLNTN